MNVKRCLFFAGLFSMLLAASPAARAVQSLQVDSVVAMVNTQVVTLGDLILYAQPVEQQLKQTYDGVELESRLAEAYSNALVQLIDKALIVEEFKRQKGEIPERALTDYLNRVIHERFKDDRVKLMDLLSKERMTYEEWRSSMRDNLIVSIQRDNEVMRRVAVAPRALREAYEARLGEYTVPAQVRISVLLLQLGETEDDRRVKRAEAEALLKRLREGEDFAALAREHSEGFRASEGGLQAWMNADDLRPELREAVESIRPGEITDVIETDAELYVIRLEGEREASVRPFDQVRDELEEELRRAEAERLYTEWMNLLRQRFHVVVYDVF